MLWLLAIYGTGCACVAIHYCFECRRLAVQQVWLREALRERDAAEREPTQAAFQAGFQAGIEAQVEVITAPNRCSCSKCRRERRYEVN